MLKAKLETSVRLGRDALYPLPAELIVLLKAIRRHGSLVRAASEAAISYRHAWGLLGRWEAITGRKLAKLTRGHGTGLTTFGERFADIGNWLERRVDRRFDGMGRDLVEYLNVGAEPRPQRVRVHASHDIALIKLKERLEPQLALDLRFEGSLTSLDSLARGECDVAGFHLPDPPRLLGNLLGEFGRRLSSREHYVVALLSRHQGLMFGRALARRVRRVNDIARLGLRFVNRERGSGTRLLFDALLARDGVSSDDIPGYDQEEYTHMATAATVRAGVSSDIAFGIEAAAKAYGLHFVPMVAEHYYLACRRTSPARIAIDAIVTAARSTAFTRAVARIGGYDTKITGVEAPLRRLLAEASPKPAAK